MKKLNLLLLVPGLFLLSQSSVFAETATATIEFEGTVASTCSFGTPANGTFTASGVSLTTNNEGSVIVTSNGGAELSVSNPTYTNSPTGFDPSGSANPWATIDDHNGGVVSSSNGTSAGILTAAVGENTYYVSVEDAIDETYIAGDYKMEVVVTCEFNVDNTSG